jgi:uncharacterized protein with NRDE domain
MCLLIVLRGRFASHPVLVAGNRDERRDRKASPPGLFVGRGRRLLSPRDRVAGGTWLAVRADGLFAGLTNRKGAPVPEGAATRGVLPHEALDAGSLDDGVSRVQQAVAERPYAGFHLVLADAARIVVLSHAAGQVEVRPWHEDHVVLSNEHEPGALSWPRLEQALQPRPSPHEQLAALEQVLLQDEDAGGHRVLKRGGEYGTVSSSLIALPAADPLQLVWRYAQGQPDLVGYSDYGNLGRRLRDD